MSVNCPSDQHLRILDRGTGQLTCHMTNCQCVLCHLWLSPQEQREWLGKK